MSAYNFIETGRGPNDGKRRTQRRQYHIESHPGIVHKDDWHLTFYEDGIPPGTPPVSWQVHNMDLRHLPHELTNVRMSQPDNLDALVAAALLRIQKERRSLYQEPVVHAVAAYTRDGPLIEEGLHHPQPNVPLEIVRGASGPIPLGEVLSAMIHYAEDPEVALQDKIDFMQDSLIGRTKNMRFWQLATERRVALEDAAKAGEFYNLNDHGLMLALGSHEYTRQVGYSNGAKVVIWARPPLEGVPGSTRELSVERWDRYAPCDVLTLHRAITNYFRDEPEWVRLTQNTISSPEGSNSTLAVRDVAGLTQYMTGSQMQPADMLGQFPASFWEDIDKASGLKV